MVRLFRINDPLRVLIALFILIGIRLPFLFSNTWVLSAEVDWLVIGESLGKGSLIYSEVWSTVSPLAAGFYWGVVSVFGKSYLALRILSILLVILQALIFNRALVKHDIYNEKTYLPAFMYVLFMNISTDFMTLSPQLLSLTFLILALNYILKPEERGKNDELLSVGIFLGIAFFFYFPSIFYLFLSLILIVLFKSSSWRSVFSILYGFLFILGLHLTFFFIKDSLPSFSFQYLTSVFVGMKVSHISLVGLLLQISLPILFFTIAAFKVFRETAFINYQVSCQQMILLWGLVGSLAAFNATRFNPAQFILLVPVLSFFVSHHLLLMKKRFAEIYINVILVFIILLGISGIFLQKTSYWPIEYQNFWMNLETSNKYENQKIIVLGETNDYYLKNSLATPYFNWELANNIHFSKMNQYSVIQSVYDAFQANKPNLIIDEKGVMEKVFYHIPELANQYEKISEDTYKLKFEGRN